MLKDRDKNLDLQANTQKNSGNSEELPLNALSLILHTITFAISLTKKQAFPLFLIPFSVRRALLFLLVLHQCDPHFPQT